jgi:hypothetical protein
MSGMPVKSENRTITGRVAAANIGDRLSVLADVAGVKLPSARMPLA